MVTDKELPACFEKEVVSRKMALAFLDISHVTFWKLEKSGRIKSSQLGNKKYYLMGDLKRLKN